jgi:heme-degrading monooxygenase HmoA
MFLTMNRFKVRPGQEAAFEAVWTGRDSHLPAVKGFVAFHLMKGPQKDGYRLYASHTLWESEAAFTDWTRSEAFRAAHKGAGGQADLYLGPPDLEVFEAVQTITAG